MTQYRFWNRKDAEERLEVLEAVVRREADKLSDFRKDEAVFLALTDDERSEMHALQILVREMFL